MIHEWREHLDALQRSNLREARRLRDQPADYSRALSWLSEAWELADKYGPAHDPAALREQHLHELLHMRQTLARSRLAQ
jgi:hypothetical protein